MSNESTNQNAQKPAAALADTLAVKLARAAAFAHCTQHSYLPQTHEQANSWQPHEWGVAAIHTAALIASQPVGATVKDSLAVGGGQAVGQEPAFYLGASDWGHIRIPMTKHRDVRALRHGFDHGDTTLVPFYAAPPAQAVDQAKPDPTLLEFYQVTDYPTLVAALESHVLKLIDTCERNVKPWEDTFPPTLLPKWQREQRAQAVDLAQFRVLAAKFDGMGDEEVGDAYSGPYYQCAQELRALIDSQEMGREPNSAPNRLTEQSEFMPVMLKGIGKINGDGWKDTTTIGEVVYVWPNELPKPYAPGQYDRVGNQCGWTASTHQYDFQPATHAEVREFVEAMATKSWERAAELDRLNPDRAVACGQAAIITKDSTNG
ncbi:hypothetical protein [Stenotrophomonas sp. NY11291]|uniref:hypothetical protein n=1 Tax=Stenotrophomonas sp. NY11291 TaxID=2939415 RepID=UPI00200D588E|nr:hypothetical protein [Stenotrophomonas sp. NY11291]UQA21538.1 hypothetical protein M1L61_17405 [Stenotrophomonas sp. NY11291]